MLWNIKLCAEASATACIAVTLGEFRSMPGPVRTNQLKRLLLALLCLLHMEAGTVLFAQATVLGSDGISGSYSTYNVNDLGIFRQYRFQATAAAASGVRKWEWCSGTAAIPDYTTNWRPYTGPLTISAYNQTIPPVGGTASAVFNTGSGGTGGFLQAVTSGNYYTFNITEYSTPGTPANEYMGVLQTSFNPVTITSVTQSPLAASVYPENSVYVTVTTSATPSAGEYIYVRYSTSLSFTSSTLLPVTISGTTGTVEIPCQAVGTTIYYYAYSSNRTSAVILADVVTNGQVAHDMSTLNLNNNGGPNYTYTVAPSIGFCGNYYVPSACYPTIASFVTALNAGTVSCAVICNVAAGHTETAPAGGINLTQTGTSANTITFQKSGAGANPVINAQVGTITMNTSSTVVDGIFSLNGSDYITIDGIDLVDNNVTTSSRMEYGYALFKNSTTDGCQNNTIKNCNITLKSANISTGPGQFEDGSRGIFAGNVTRTAINASLMVTSASGRNDNNTYIGNTIKNVHAGIILRGYIDSSPFTFYDQNNIIGQSGAGNIIENYGSGGSSPVYGIFVIHQNNHQISYNSIDNDASGGSAASNTLYGIFNSGNNPGNVSSVTIENNTISLTQGSSSNGIWGIKAGSGGYLAGTVNINYNTIQNCTFSVSSSGSFRAIENSFDASSVYLTHNIIQNNTLLSTANSGLTGDIMMIGNYTSTTNITITDNQLLNNSKTANGTANVYGYYNSTNPPAGGTFNISNNTINGLSCPTTSGSSVVGIYNVSSGGSNIKTINNNTISNITAGTSGTVHTAAITSDNMISGSQVNNNIISNIASETYVRGICCANATGGGSNNIAYTVSGNTLSNISTKSSVNVDGILLYLNNSGTTVTASGNTIDGFTCSNATSCSLRGIIAVNAASGASFTISGNTVANISHSIGTATGGFLDGIWTSTACPVTISGNNIHDISSSASGTVNINAIRTGFSGTSYTITNNYIQRISAPSSTYSNAVIGINTGGNTQNVYYNTIALGENSVLTGAAGFGCSGVFSNASTLNLRNNIIYINSNGSGLSACVKISAIGSAYTISPTFSSASNNNFYYINYANYNYIYVQGTTAGTGGTIVNGYAWSGAAASMTYNLNNDPCFNVIGSDNTSYKYFMSPRESGSYYDVPPFAGGASLPQNLKLTSGSTNYAESHAGVIAGITTDWEGDIRSGSTPDIGADEGGFTVLTATCELLPLELLNLRGSHIEKYGINELRWQTGNEVNTDLIGIERSADGLQFETIGELPAAGNSAVLLDYLFQDDAPLYGNNYYRLKMSDKDGSFTYSNTINIYVTADTAIELRIYPNPVHDILNADFYSVEATELEFIITDISGRNMLYSIQRTDAGTVTISLDTKQLSPGIYLLTVKDLHTGSTEFSNFMKSTTH